MVSLDPNWVRWMGRRRGRGGRGGTKRESATRRHKTEASTNRFAKGRRRGEVTYASAIINQSIIEAAQAQTHTHIHTLALERTHTIAGRHSYSDRKTNPDVEREKRSTNDRAYKMADT